MNLVEHFIEKIHEVKEVDYEHGSFILADLTTDCYGRISRSKTSFSSWEEWYRVEGQGYYLG